MSDLAIYLLGLFKMIKQFWPVLFFLIIKLPDLRRWEKDEDERVKEAIKKRDAKRVYCNTNVKEL